MSAGGKAILDTGALDAFFTDSQERRRLQGLAFSEAKKSNTANIALSTGRLGLRKAGFEHDKKQLPTATGLGVANVVLSGFKGYNAAQAKTKEASSLDALTEAIKKRL